MRFVQIDNLPSGKALVDVNTMTKAVAEGGGTRLFLSAQRLDVPHTLAELEDVLAGRDSKNGSERGGAGFHVR